MCGWFRLESALASRSKRALNASSAATCSGSTLIATVRPRRVSVALYTSPIPPAPRGAMTSYGPSRVPGASATLRGRFYRENPSERLERLERLERPIITAQKELPVRNRLRWLGVLAIVIGAEWTVTGKDDKNHDWPA